MISSLSIVEEAHVEPRNFRQEVRGLRDTEYLDCRSVIVLNQETRDLEVVILHLFESLKRAFPEDDFDRGEFLSKIYAEDNGKPKNPFHGRKLRNRVQSIIEEAEFDENAVNERWMVTYCSLDGVRKTHIAIVRMQQETNFGPFMEQCQLIVLVVAPAREKSTKSARETATTYATLLSTRDVFDLVLSAPSGECVKEVFRVTAREAHRNNFVEIECDDRESKETEEMSCVPFRGIINDVRRRAKHYISDYTDGVKDIRSIRKSISAALFLICTVLPTAVAYGMLNDDNTNGLINVEKVVIGQWIGGIYFALIGGQGLLILTTSAPLSIYIQVVYRMAVTENINFYSLYCWVGIYAQLFLVLYSVFNLANLVKYTKRSTEEIFSMFIACTLTYKAFRAIISTYIHSYRGCHMSNTTSSLLLQDGCAPSSALLFILLAFGVLAISLGLDHLRATHYFSEVIRDTVADYALPIAVVLMALISRLMFYNVDKERFNLYPDRPDVHWTFPDLLPGNYHGTALGLAFPLSLLFYMDQLLVTKTVDNKQNNLKKGSAHHWDFFVVAILNIFLSLFGLPWMHAALPSAFLHLKALADVDHRIYNGVMSQVIARARETRVAVLLAHILIIPIYFLLIPYFTYYIPTAIFHGLFLFMALSSLTGNELFERVQLLFTDQKAYPARHYLRRVPQRVVHIFTIVELLQLAVLLVVGFYPNRFVRMAFPVVIAIFIPFRQFIVPLLFSKYHLDALDSTH